MNLVRFGGGRLGVLQDGRIYDATTLTGDDPATWPPVGMLHLIDRFDTLRPQLEELPHQGPGIALEETRLEAPLVWPNKLLAYPVNYIAHGQEMASPNRADRNGFFLKAASSLSGPQDPIVLPDLPSREIHHECELGVIVGKGGRHIAPQDAWDHIFGYCCLIDVTVRGKEERVMRKSYDSFTPIGPAIITADEVEDAAELDMKLWVNDELRQHANTRDLIVDIPGMIVLASSVATLEAGDLIATGTPAGVGRIRAGDRVTIEIEQIGRMSVQVEQGQGGANIALKREDAQ